MSNELGQAVQVALSAVRRIKELEDEIEWLQHRVVNLEAAAEVRANLYTNALDKIEQARERIAEMEAAAPKAGDVVTRRETLEATRCVSAWVGGKCCLFKTEEDALAATLAAGQT